MAVGDENAVSGRVGLSTRVMMGLNHLVPPNSLTCCLIQILVTAQKHLDGFLIQPSSNLKSRWLGMPRMAQLGFVL